MDSAADQQRCIKKLLTLADLTAGGAAVPESVRDVAGTHLRMQMHDPAYISICTSIYKLYEPQTNKTIYITLTERPPGPPNDRESLP